MKTTTHVSIIGSCVCRDAFSIPQATEEYGSDENEYIVDRFIQGINPLSAIGSPVAEITATALIEESKFSSAPPFYKRCYMLDLTKAWDSFLSETSSDYLIIDFTTVRLDCRKIDGGLVTFDGVAKDIVLGLGSASVKEATSHLVNAESVSLSNFDEDTLRQAYFKYIDRLLRLYPQEKIIVVEARHAMAYIDPEGGKIATSSPALEQRYIRENKLIDFAYRCAKEKLEKAHFIDALPICVGNVRHKWGQGGLHFVNEIYSYIYRSIDGIIHNRLSRENERLFLLELKEKYTQEIFNYYSATANECVRDSRNTLDYSLGMKVGKYEQNGVCLTVNSDYTFSICGTACEDTVFYLYQAQQSPLGEWRSVPVITSPSRYAFSTRIKNQDKSFFIQLVLTDNEADKMWISGDFTAFVTVKKPYHYRLVRAIIRKGTAVDAEGKLYFEKI
ncbi:MAG: hypothetical protein J6B29_03365 [Clostridia bacterium]|nr:hypothetical protein [Clostridia bacterium]